MLGAEATVPVPGLRFVKARPLRQPGSCGGTLFGKTGPSLGEDGP